MTRGARRLAGLLMAAVAGAAVGQDVRLSAFGTLGYAQSNRSWNYQRFIDDRGSLSRDSRLGVQLDAPLAPAWSFMMQALASPAVDSDRRWDATLPWAFLAWRPDNNLLLRAGVLRLPLQLYSESHEVGTTYSFARLPVEVYSLTPTADMRGVSVSHSWLGEQGDLDLEGYVGHVDSSWRFYSRDGMPGGRDRGAVFVDIHGVYSGLILTARQGDSRLRLGMHRGVVSRRGGAIVAGYPWVPAGGGLGYYQVSNAQPGPGVPTVDHIVNYSLTAGAEVALPADFMLIGEAARRKVQDVTIGTDSWAAYLALQRRIGAWTPYAYIARIRSSQASRRLYAAIDGNRWPDALPGAALVNLSQRSGADGLGIYDQQSVAVGTAYALTPNQLLKAEWLHSRIGLASDFVDTPTGERSGGRSVDVLSVSYSFVF